MRYQELCFSAFVLSAAIASDNCRHSRNMRLRHPETSGKPFSHCLSFVPNWRGSFWKAIKIRTAMMQVGGGPAEHEQRRRQHTARHRPSRAPADGGAGVRYAVVYKANRDQIRNPNRIYSRPDLCPSYESARAGRPESLTATRWKFMRRVPRLWGIDAPESSQLRRGGR